MSVEKLLLAKEEVTYGVDPTPSAANAMETMGMSMSRYEGDVQARELDRSVLGGNEGINTNPHTMSSFSIPLAGSGAAGTPPAYGVLLKACGMDETLNGVIDVSYQMPATQAGLAAADSVTFWDYRSQVGKAQKSSGCRGKCSISMGKGELPKIEFGDFLGSYTRPEALAQPSSIDWTGWKAEVPFTESNVPTLTLDGVAACTESFSVDIGQEVARRNLPGCNQTVLTGYTSTGNMTVVAPNIASKNWFEKLESHNGISKVPLALVLGTVAGLTVSIDCAEVQITNVSEGESSEGDLSYSFDLAFLSLVVLKYT